MTEAATCNLCSSSSQKLLYRKFGLAIVRCRRCGLAFANPMLPEAEILKRYESPLFFEEYLKSLRADASGYDSGFIRSHYHLFLHIVERLFAPGKRLLDVGCGAGFFLKAAEEAGWKAEGVEISAAAASYAENVVGIPVRRGRLEALRLPSEAYDLVTMLDVLEHVGDPAAFLAEACRILKPGGTLVISTPDFDSLSRRILGKSWAALSPAEHLFYITRKTLRSYLERANFTVAGIKNFLIFNPEYSHVPNGRRARLWKHVHDRLEKKKFMANLHGFEYLDLMKLAGGRAPELLGGRPLKKWKKRAYRRAKRWLRGDMLIAVAGKGGL